jgi:hypothetical protein
LDANVNDDNPYSPPKEQPREVNANSLAKRDDQLGPAIPIVAGMMMGGLAGVPLLINESALGFIGILPGAILGGVYFRVRSSQWPVDPTAHKRRYGYAILVTLLFPAVAAVLTGMRGQGLPSRSSQS